MRVKEEFYYLIFSLFHHNVYHKDDLFDFETNIVHKQLSCDKETSLTDIANVIYQTVVSNLHNFKDSDISLTLTGGMDSRVILACLLKTGIKPNCLTYGNPKAKDIVFAKKLANSFGLNFHNVCKEAPTKEWYFRWVVETIKRDQGNSHLHRAHRTAAIAEHAEMYAPKVLFTGHMGGEGLRGLTYNNYFASSFFEMVNEGKASPNEAARNVFDNYFLKYSDIELNKLIDTINELSWMKHDHDTNKFFFLYDLVAKIHHAQDIRLYKSFVPTVVPVFLGKDYLEMLFSSDYSFLSKPKGFFRRLTNPLIHSKLIELIYPKLLDFPLSNGYSPREYLRGHLYYLPVKTFRKFVQSTQYSSSFSYGKWYTEFVREHSQNISQEIWDIFDKDKYIKDLQKEDHGTDEGYWHKFSNPIFYDLLGKYRKGKI